MEKYTTFSKIELWFQLEIIVGSLSRSAAGIRYLPNKYKNSKYDKEILFTASIQQEHTSERNIAQLFAKAIWTLFKCGTMDSRKP